MSLKNYIKASMTGIADLSQFGSGLGLHEHNKKKQDNANFAQANHSSVSASEGGEEAGYGLGLLLIYVFPYASFFYWFTQLGLKISGFFEIGNTYTTVPDWYSGFMILFGLIAAVLTRIFFPILMTTSTIGALLALLIHFFG